MSLDATIEQVIARTSAIPGVVAVLLTGSAARNELLPHSDYDFLIVIDDAAPLPFRDGGREAYIGADGRQVEIGFGTLKRSRAKIAESVALGIPFRAGAFAEAKVLVRNGDSIDSLIEEARALLAKAPPAMDHQDLLWDCFDIWNQMKDLEDVVEDEATSSLIAAPLFEHLLRFYFRLERVWLPRRKALMGELAEVGPECHELASAYVRARTATARVTALKAMMTHLARRFDLIFETGYVSAR